MIGGWRRIEVEIPMYSMDGQILGAFVNEKTTLLLPAFNLPYLRYSERDMRWKGWHGTGRLYEPHFLITGAASLDFWFIGTTGTK